MGHWVKPLAAQLDNLSLFDPQDRQGGRENRLSHTL